MDNIAPTEPTAPRSGKARKGRKTAGERADATILSKFLTETVGALQDEENRAFYLFAGVGLLYSMIAIPVAALKLTAPANWIVGCPGILVILLAFLRDRARKARQSSPPQSESPAPPRSARDDETPRKATLTGEIQESKDFEIVMYWGYRPAAHDDVRREIRHARREIFLAGVGLSTISTTLNEPDTLDALALAVQNEPTFRITVLFSDQPHPGRAQEDGGEGITENVRSARRALARFREGLSNRLPRGFPRDPVVVRAYDETITPRHFILKTDRTIYVGSYLSHVPGVYSYLLKLCDYGEGIYKLFDDEISYLIDHSHPVTLSSSKEQHTNELQ